MLIVGVQHEHLLLACYLGTQFCYSAKIYQTYKKSVLNIKINKQIS